MMTYGYQLRRVSGPEHELLTLDEAKRQSKIDADLTAEEPDLEFWIATARELAESYTKRTLVECSWEVRLADFPRTADQRLYLPMGTPLVSIESFRYLDGAGAAVALEGEAYQAAAWAEPAYLLPLPGEVWPSTSCSEDAVLITYRAGYPGTGSPGGVENVPRLALQAVRGMVAHWYANREAVTDGRGAPVEMPYAFERLLDPLRVLP